jgi:hypothetical protein
MTYDLLIMGCLRDEWLVLPANKPTAGILSPLTIDHHRPGLPESER